MGFFSFFTDTLKLQGTRKLQKKVACVQGWFFFFLNEEDFKKRNSCVYKANVW